MISETSRIVEVEELILATISGLETTWVFSAFEPSIFTMQTLGCEKIEQTTRLIRRGYIVGLTFGLGFSAFIGYLLYRAGRRHWFLPILVSGAIGAGFIGVYETALAGGF